MARTKEQIIADLKADKDFADLPEDEIEEMAEMEFNAQGERRYEQGDKPRKKAERPKKIDEVKRDLITSLFGFVATLPQVKNAQVTNDQKTIDFAVVDEEYTLTLTKHRPKK